MRMTRGFRVWKDSAKADVSRNIGPYIGPHATRLSWAFFRWMAIWAIGCPVVIAGLVASSFATNGPTLPGYIILFTWTIGVPIVAFFTLLAAKSAAAEYNDLPKVFGLHLSVFDRQKLLRTLEQAGRGPRWPAP